MVDLFTDEFKVIEYKGHLQIQIPYTEIADAQGRQIVLKARVKVAGRVWSVHKNDSDPFPSNPHAHNYEDGTKLNLVSGEVLRNKYVVGKLSDSALLSIQSQLRELGFNL